ncbi:1-phosphofructokinase [Psychromonas ossibalaenae]|uniref:1-phosphofructokinase n=1 Tax=Psychromonas ossibalaenae TaxID=444922 RepID=UPI00037F7B6D|nr:1-phosphofructokinase [Psychromonas ossibalaenae]
MSHPLKVVTVTLNPALDLTGSLNELVKGTVNLLDSGSLHPAGKGINVAKVLSELGAQVTATGLLGADNQEPFVQLFESLNINDQFVRAAGATRINVKIVENSGQVSDLNFPGITVTEQQLQQFENTLLELAQSHEIFVIAGSLPQGLTPERCAKWIKQLQAAGKKVFFDSSNGALVAGVQAGPYLIKPNDEELSVLTAETLSSSNDIQKAAEKLQHQGCENVVISLGEKGVLWIDQNGWIKSQPPKMTVVSTVGAGDTLVAGLCWGELKQWQKPQTLSFATALAALAVSQIGVGAADINQVLTVQENVQIEQSMERIEK